MTAFVLLAMIALCPQKAEAKYYYDHHITNLPQNTWKETGTLYDYKYIAPNHYTTYNFLKIKVPKNGYVRFDSNDIGAQLLIQNTLKKKSFHTDDAYIYGYDQKTYYFVLPGGTYYVYADRPVKIKWSFIKAANPSNYSRGNAKKLASGKKERIVFNTGQEYDRWYKIVLNKKKKITINHIALDVRNYGEGAGIHTGLEIYDKDGNQIKYTYSKDGKSVKTSSIPAGTYYLQVSMLEFMSNWPWQINYRIHDLSWK
jgi:hypothetical protein